MTDNPALSPDDIGAAGQPAQPSDLGTRVVAKLIDYIVLFVVYSVVLVPLMFSTMFGLGAFGGFAFSGAAFAATAVSTALFYAYFVVLEMTRGQTLGKMLLKIQVTGAGGGNPTLEEALKRNAWMFVGIVPVIGGLAVLAAAIYILVTINDNVQTRQGWHDTFAAETFVVKGA